MLVYLERNRRRQRNGENGESEKEKIGVRMKSRSNEEILEELKKAYVAVWVEIVSKFLEKTPTIFNTFF